MLKFYVYISPIFSCRVTYYFDLLYNYIVYCVIVTLYVYVVM